MKFSLKGIHSQDDTAEDQDFVDFYSRDDSAKTLASTPGSYRYENGRRYHSYRDGAYWGPNDDKDSHHQTITHHLYCLTLDDRLFLAPLSDPQNVVDIGTGRGLWAMDFADQFPNANVIGTDLSPVWEPVVQPNLRFEVDDCCSEWTYPPDTRERFDFIHMRGLYGSVADWPKLYKDCINHLTPGGYFEQAEITIKPLSDDGTLREDSPLHKYYEIGIEAQKITGKRVNIVETMRQDIINAGFLHVVETRFKWPVGPWSSDPRMKEIGRWMRQFWEHGMEGWVLALCTRHLEWEIEDVRSLISKTREALHDPKIHAYFEVSIVYGRKPFDSPSPTADESAN
ncbi:hypothetical protein AJ80_05867 [Polytolypa hystricis UAMH7299]|uniref:Methyltransferase domain-containing protein n=1 Tax=Polytolypa hystricis (strain UAMH7299) TaxID=1447883 RepID=A0A2B7Y1G2_POLH7|nr:hypothetical protein AJ80_05867 [Polytolypa hystricis UAMH7299]